MVEKDPVLEGIMAQLGDFGTYQFRQHLLHVLLSFVGAIHMLGITFTVPTPDSRCFIPQVDEYNETVKNVAGYIPQNVNGALDTCSKYRTEDNTTFTNETVTCEGRYFYNTTYYPTSKVIDWNLVCDKQSNLTLLQSIPMFGVLCGSVVLGILADRFGRKPILCISTVLTIVFGLASAFINDYYLYAVALFFYGAFGAGGPPVTGFVLTSELVGPSVRTICGVMVSVAFAFGEMAIPFWAWLVPNDQHLQIIYASHSVLLLGYWWLCDESIRWLWSQGRKEEALEIASKAAKVNGKRFVRHPNPTNATSKRNIKRPELDSRQINENFTESDGSKEHLIEAKSGLIALWRSTILRLRGFIMSCIWFANCLVYYGLIFNVGKLPGNPHLLFGLIGLAEIPGFGIVILLLDRMGRRFLGSLLLFIGGFSCLVIACIPQGAATIILAMLAKIAVSGSFAICFNYTAELFPTNIRNSVMGIVNMAGRAGGMLAPAIVSLGSINQALPAIIFASVAMSAVFFGLFLPETLNKDIPQTIEDGENFGKGDNGFRTMWTFFKRKLLSQQMYVVNEVN